MNGYKLMLEITSPRVVAEPQFGSMFGYRMTLHVIIIIIIIGVRNFIYPSRFYSLERYKYTFIFAQPTTNYYWTGLIYFD